MNIYNWDILGQDRFDSTLFNNIYTFCDGTDSFNFSNQLFTKAIINDITSDAYHVNLGKDKNVSQIHHKTNDLNIFIEKGFNKYINYGMDRRIYEDSISEVYSNDILDQYYNQQVDQTFTNPLLFKFDLSTIIEYFTRDSTLNDLLLDSSGCIVKLFFNIRNPIIIDSTAPTSEEIYAQYNEESSVYFKNISTILKSSLSLNKYLYDHLNSHNRTSFIFIDFSDSAYFIDLYYYQLQYTSGNLFISLYKSTIPFCYNHRIINNHNDLDDVYTNYEDLTLFDMCQYSYSLDIGCVTYNSYYQRCYHDSIENVTRNDMDHTINYNNINYVYSAVPFLKYYIKTNKVLDYTLEISSITNLDFSEIIQCIIGDPKIHRSIDDMEFISLYSLNILDSNNKQFIIPIDVTANFNNDISIVVNNVVDKSECLSVDLNFINCSYDLTSWIINQDIFSISDLNGIQEFDNNEAIISIDITSINITQSDLLNINISSDSTITKTINGQYPSPYLTIDRNLIGVKDPQPMTLFNIIADDLQHENYNSRYYTPFGSVHNRWLISPCQKCLSQASNNLNQVIPYQDSYDRQLGSLNTSMLPSSLYRNNKLYMIFRNLSKSIVDISTAEYYDIPTSEQKEYKSSQTGKYTIPGYYNSIYNWLYNIEHNYGVGNFQFSVYQVDKTTIYLPVEQITISSTYLGSGLFHVYPDESGMGMNGLGGSYEIYLRLNLGKENLLTGSAHSYQPFGILFSNLYIYRSMYGNRTYIKPIDLINDTTCIIYDDYKNILNIYYSKSSDISSSYIYTNLGASFKEWNEFGGGGQGIVIRPDETTLLYHSSDTDPTMIIIKGQDSIIAKFPSVSYIPLHGSFPIVWDSSTFFDNYGSTIIKRFDLIDDGDYQYFNSTDIVSGSRIIGVEPDGTSLEIITMPSSYPCFTSYSVTDNTQNEITDELTHSQYIYFAYHHSDGKYYVIGSTPGGFDKVFFRASYDDTTQTVEKEQIIKDIPNLIQNDVINYSSSFLKPIDSSTQYGYFNSSLSVIKPFAFKLTMFEEDTTAILFIDINQIETNYPLYVKNERTKISRNLLYTRERGGMINGEFVVLIAGSPFQLNEYDDDKNIMIYEKYQNEELTDYLCIPNCDSISYPTVEFSELMSSFPATVVNIKNSYWVSNVMNYSQYTYVSKMNIFNININEFESNIKLYRKFFAKSFYVKSFESDWFIQPTIGGVATPRWGGLGIEYKGLVIQPAYETSDSYVIGGKFITKRSTHIRTYYTSVNSIQSKKISSSDRDINSPPSGWYGSANKQQKSIDKTDILYESNGSIYKYLVDENILNQVNILPDNKFQYEYVYSINSNYLIGYTLNMITDRYSSSLIRYSKERNRYYNLGARIQHSRSEGYFDYCNKRYNISSKALIADTCDQMTIIKTTPYLINDLGRTNIFDDQSNTLYYQSIPIHRISTNPIFHSNVLTSDICPETFNEYQNCVHTTTDGSHQSLGYGLYQKKSIYDKINVHKVCEYDQDAESETNGGWRVLRNAQVNDQPSQNFGTLKKCVHNANITGYSFNNDQNIIGATAWVTANPDFTPNSFVKIDSTTLYVMGVSKVDWTIGLNCEFSDYGRKAEIYLRKQYYDLTFGTFTTYEDVTCEVFSAFSPSINFSDLTHKSLNYMVDQYLDISVSDSSGNSNNIIFDNPLNVFKRFNNNKYNWLAWTSFYKQDNSVDAYTMFPELSKIFKCRFEYDSSVTFAYALLQHMFKQVGYDATSDILDIPNNLFYYYPLSMSYDNSLMQFGCDVSGILMSLSLVDGTVINQYTNKYPVYKKRNGSTFELIYRKYYITDEYISYQTLLGEDGTIYNDHAIDILTEHILENKTIDTTNVIVTSVDNVMDFSYNDTTIYGISIGDKVTYVDKNWIYDGSNIIILDIKVRDMNAQSSKNLSIIISKNNQYQNISGESFDLIKDGASSYHKNEIIQKMLNGSLSIGEIVEVSTYPLDVTSMIKFYDYDERSFKCFDPKYGLVYKVNGVSIYDGVFFYGNTSHISYDTYGKQSGEFAIQDNMHSLMQYHDKLPNVYFTPYKTDDIWGYPVPYMYDQTNMIFMYNAPIGTKKIKFDFDVVAMINYNLKLFNTVKDVIEAGFITEKIGDFSGYFPYSNFVLEIKRGKDEHTLFKRYIKVWADYTFVDFTDNFPASSLLGLDTSYNSLNTISGGLAVYYGRQPNYNHMTYTSGYYKDYTNNNPNQGDKINPLPTYLTDVLPFNFCSYNDNTIYTEQRLIPSFVGEKALEFYVNIGCVQGATEGNEVIYTRQPYSHQLLPLTDVIYLFPTHWKSLYTKVVGSLYITYYGNTYSIVNKDIKTKNYNYVNDNTFTKIDKNLNRYDFIQVKKVSENQTKGWFKQLDGFSDSTLKCFGSGLSLGTIKSNPVYNMDKIMQISYMSTYLGGSISRSEQDKAIVLSPGETLTGKQEHEGLFYGKFQFGQHSSNQQRPPLDITLNYFIDVYNYYHAGISNDPGIQYNDPMHLISQDKQAIAYGYGGAGSEIIITLSANAPEDVTLFGFSFSARDQLDTRYYYNNGSIRVSTFNETDNYQYYKLVYGNYDDFTDTITMCSININEMEDNTITLQSSSNDYSIILLSQDISNSLNILTDGTNSQDSTSIVINNAVKYKLKIKPESGRSSPVIVNVNSPHIDEQTIVCIKKI